MSWTGLNWCGLDDGVAAVRRAGGDVDETRQHAARGMAWPGLHKNENEYCYSARIGTDAPSGRESVGRAIAMLFARSKCIRAEKAHLCCGTQTISTLCAVSYVGTGKARARLLGWPRCHPPRCRHVLLFIHCSCAHGAPSTSLPVATDPTFAKCITTNSAHRARSAL